MRQPRRFNHCAHRKLKEAARGDLLQMPKMENSPLNRLPAELRCYIYELALTYQGKLVVTSHSTTRLVMGPYVLVIKPFQDLQAVTATCRQIYHEASSIIFSCNDFQLDFRRSTFHGPRDNPENMRTLVRHFLAAVRARQGNMPRSLEVDFGYIDIYERLHIERFSWNTLAVGLRYLRAIAATLPRCDVRLGTRVNIHGYPIDCRCSGDCCYNENSLSVDVRDVASSLSSFETHVRQRLEDGCVPRRLGPETAVKTLRERLRLLTTAFESEDANAGSEGLLASTTTGHARSFLEQDIAVIAGETDDAEFAAAMVGLSMQRHDAAAYNRREMRYH
ncbi:hypothetical protein LTR17_001096 [Elasticomyces elasticus]|nr:hypothetical protein LTR17_001096 [Elasticomyces elasticus]